MNKIMMLTAIGAVSSCLLLTGCQPGQNTAGSTFVGATAGGLIGGSLFQGRNQAAGVIVGALIGGIIGNQIGRYMDAQDRANMQSAIIHTPIGQQATWTNPNTRAGAVTYNVRPVKAYRTSSNQYCREYQTNVTIGGKVKSAYGRACRQPDGSWKIIK